MKIILSKPKGRGRVQREIEQAHKLDRALARKAKRQRRAFIREMHA